MAYFHCLIGGGSSGGGYELTVTCDADFAGTTITCTDGVTTLTQTCPSASPYEVEFDIPNGGDWTISGIYQGDTISTQINIPDSVSLDIKHTPDGSTVTPTDDIQIWLACANITDKSYTTLAEVLADRETFETLIADSNACDYMARSTSWAGDSTVKVPTMTSNTAPSGEAFASSTYSSSYPAYYAFDGNDTTFWSSQSSGNQYVGYKFTSAVNINKLYIYPNLNSGTTYEFKLQGSNDNSDWTDLKTFEVDGLTPTYIDVDSNDSYMYYRVFRDNGWQAFTIQFYKAGITTSQDAMSLIGKYDYCSNALLNNVTWAEAIVNSDYFEEVLNVKVPVMTGYTTPEGRVITDSELGGDSISWKAFDNNTNTSWESQQGVTQAYCGYIFTSPVAIKKVAILGNDPSSSYIYSPKDFNIEWSDDESTWTTDSTNFTYTVNQGSSALHNFFSPTLNGSHKGWRINAHNTWGANYLTVRTIQFYGRASSNVSNTNGIIHTANGDTVYYINGQGQQVSIDASDFDFSSLDEGVYTFGSTTAKNPSDLSQDYTKQFRITKSPYGGTTELYLMPDAVKTLYWWGYMANSGGFTNRGGTAATKTLTLNTYDIEVNVTSGTCAVGTNQTINTDGFTKLCGITKATNKGITFISSPTLGSAPQNDGYGRTGILSQNNAIEKLQADLTNTGDVYTYIFQSLATNQTSKSNTYALWYE